MKKESKKLLLEACVKSYSEGLQAQMLGAHRIELCDNLSEGGTTPSYPPHLQYVVGKSYLNCLRHTRAGMNYGTIYMSVKKLTIPSSAMIRPNGDTSFCYTEDEIHIMEQDIAICKQLGADGVVFGALTKEQEIDLPLTKRLVDLARPLKTTFHMAFDQVRGDPKAALDSLIALGLTRVLTKGFAKNATEGQPLLKQLIDHAHGRIVVLPGGGLTQSNVEAVAAFTGASELHGTKIVGSLASSHSSSP